VKDDHKDVQSVKLVVSHQPQKVRCKAKNKKTGKQCQQWAVTGYEVCYHHGANPRNKGGAPAGNRYAATHGVFINDLLTDEERLINQHFYNALYRDFELNDSSDDMLVQTACIYFIRLVRAIRSNNEDSIARMDSLLSKKLAELKVTREEREGKTINLRTSPSEWAIAILEKARQQGLLDMEEVPALPAPEKPEPEEAE